MRELTRKKRIKNKKRWRAKTCRLKFLCEVILGVAVMDKNAIVEIHTQDD